MARFYLDSNVYSYVTEQAELRQVHAYFERLSATVLASDTVILEAGRIPTQEERLRRMSAVRVLSQRRVEPLPLRQSEELVREIRRCHPEWLRPTPDLRAVERFLKRSERVWKRVRNDRLFDPAEGIPRYLNATAPGVAGYLAQQRQIRQLRLAGELEYEASEPHFQVLLEPLSQSERYWRLASAGLWAAALEGVPSVSDLKDYLGAYVLPIRDPSAWKYFWYRDVTPAAMPLGRLLFSAEFHQTTTRITHGHVLDAHHSVYLADCDFFLTCDGDLHEVLDLVVKEVSPLAPLARPILVKRHVSKSSLLAITEALEESATA